MRTFGICWIVLVAGGLRGNAEPSAKARDVGHGEWGRGGLQGARWAIRNVCLRQLPTCVVPFADGGRRCTDNSQCRAASAFSMPFCVTRAQRDSDHPPQPGEKVIGKCLMDDDPCGLQGRSGRRKSRGRVCVD